ncbi:MAG: glycosyltransferase family 1 protein [Planctomycetota bacterium]|nr:glycosyltransferase family 1 protein [Planctomycetota bacterium]
MTSLIGFDAREAFRKNPRGIGLYCRHLLREFGAIEHDFRFLAYHERPAPSGMPELPRSAHAKQVTMKGDRFYLWERIRMPWELRRDRVDVYHGTYNTLPPRLIGWGAMPMVVTLHDVIVTWWNEHTEEPYIKYCRGASTRIVREAAKILTVSDWSKQDICERFNVPEQKVEVFHNGIHPDFLVDPHNSVADEARAEFAAGRPYIYCLGAPTPRKNTAGFIDALGLLQQRGHLDVAAVITGVDEQHQADFREQIARLGLEKDVFLYGYITREQMIGLYAGAVLTVYPSHAEGWGIPIVESLAIGTPVATSKTTAMPEAGGDFASYFDPASREDMAEVIQTAIHNAPNFGASRAEAQARARTFTWRAAAEKTLDVYRELAGG